MRRPSSALSHRLARLETRRRGPAIVTLTMPFGAGPIEREKLRANFVPPPSARAVLEIYATAPSADAWEKFCVAETTAVERLRAAAAEAAEAARATTADAPAGPPHLLH